jgi:hypothetical protein
MSHWKVTWFDGGQLRETVVFSDPYGVVSAASNEGVSAYAIIKIERMPA